MYVYECGEKAYQTVTTLESRGSNSVIFLFTDFESVLTVVLCDLILKQCMNFVNV